MKKTGEPTTLRRAFARLLPQLAYGLLVVWVMASGTARAEHGDHAPRVNWWTWNLEVPPVGWFLVDFAIFVALIVYLARKPVRAMFARRHDTIKRTLAEATAAHETAIARQRDCAAKLAGADSEAETLSRQGRTDGETERDAIMAQAKAYAERLRADAAALERQELQRATVRLRREVVDEMLVRTEETLRRDLTDRDRLRLVEESIALLENDGSAMSTASGSAGAAQ
jgi:F-type H+-transporting ATPase subunit b